VNDFEVNTHSNGEGGRKAGTGPVLRGVASFADRTRYDFKTLEIFETSGDLVLVVSPSGKILYANRLWRDSLGFEENDLEDLSLFDVTRTEDHAICQAWLRQSEQLPEQVREVELVFKGKGPLEIPVRGTTSAELNQGEVVCLRGFFMDLTRQLQAEAERQEAFELFHVLSSHAPVGIFRVDGAGRIFYVNRRWRDLAQMPHLPRPRGVWWQMIHTQDRDRAVRSWSSALRHGHEMNQEFRVQTGGEASRWVRIRLAPIGNGQGRVRSWVGTVEDITEQQLAAAVLQRTQEDLERMVQERTHALELANQDLAEFAHVVSHDLKAPLRAVSNLSEWIAKDFSDRLGEDGTEMFQRLRQRVQHMQQMISGILSYTRLGRVSSEEINLNFTELMGDIVQVLAPPPGIHVRWPKDNLTIRGVREQIYQVFQNLLDNAVKFMDKPDGRIEIEAERRGAAWEFSVRDNGPGIESRYHQRIFLVFEQLDNPSTTKGSEGSGIGLALVKRIVENRGGNIWIESEIGQGSVFFVRWPDSPVGKW
jgi:PAS domain S-box-containing protein